MKVAFVNHPEQSYALPPKGGSIDIWIHEVGRRLAQSCDVVAYSTRGSLPEQEWCDGIHYRRVFDRGEELLKRFGRIKGAKHVAWKLHDFSSRFYYVGYSLAVANDLRSQGCDIIHFFNLSQYAPIFRRFIPKAKLVLHMQSQFLTSQSRRAVEQRLRKADRILACSRFLTDDIRGAFPEFAERCATIYNGADVKCFVPDGEGDADRNGAPLIVFAGRISPEKGLHVLLDAFALVLRRCPSAKLEVAGPNAEMPLDFLPSWFFGRSDGANELSRLARYYDGRSYLLHLKEQVDRLQLDGSVSFSGLLSRSELADHHRRARVCVVPTVGNEVFGMAAAEALSSGVPVIASRVAGLPEVIEDGTTGLLVEPNDPAALADAMLCLIDNDGLRRSMALAARQRAISLFSWDVIAQDLLRMYVELESPPVAKGSEPPRFATPGSRTVEKKCAAPGAC
jgi:glycosyltransferase involved in cell wall biosynthesis